MFSNLFSYFSKTSSVDHCPSREKNCLFVHNERLLEREYTKLQQIQSQTSIQQFVRDSLLDTLVNYANKTRWKRILSLFSNSLSLNSTSTLSEIISIIGMSGFLPLSDYVSCHYLSSAITANLPTLHYYSIPNQTYYNSSSKQQFQSLFSLPSIPKVLYYRIKHYPKSINAKKKGCKQTQLILKQYSKYIRKQTIPIHNQTTQQLIISIQQQQQYQSSRNISLSFLLPGRSKTVQKHCSFFIIF